MGEENTNKEVKPTKTGVKLGLIVGAFVLGYMMGTHRYIITDKIIF